MRIGIDIDDTICDSIEAMLPYICMKYNLDYESEKAKGYSYYEYMNLENFEDFGKKNFSDILFNAKLKDKADYYINELFKNNEIVFITARGNKFFDDPFELCKKYLDKYDIKYNKLVVDAHDKGIICMKEGIDLFIDDSVRNCSSVSDYGIKVFIFDESYNRNDDRFERVYNWKEIYEKIKNQQQMLILIYIYGAPIGIRTPNLLVRSQTLYPIELWALFLNNRQYILKINFFQYFQ